MFEAKLATMRNGTIGAAIVGLILSGSACGPTEKASQAGATPLVILAASSLKTPLESYLSAHKDVAARTSFAGSQDLAAQIHGGAPADVFISAGETHMDALVKKGFIESQDVRAIASNKLAVVFRADLQPPLGNVVDLSRPDLKILLGAPEVPIGRATQKVLGKLDKISGWKRKQFDNNVRSYEQSDLALVSKVRLGEADAAIVYQSDARNDPKLTLLPIPDELNEKMIYFAGPLVRSERLEDARKFVLRMAREGLPGLQPKPGG